MNMQINTPTPSLRSNYVAVEGLDIGYVSRHRRHVVAERLAAHAEGGTLTCLIGRMSWQIAATSNGISADTT